MSAHIIHRQASALFSCPQSTTMSRAVVLASMLLAGVLAQQTFPFSEGSGEIICDGTIRPDYDECYNEVLPKTFDGATVGPGFGEGSTFKGDKCQIRVLRCGGPTDQTFDVKDVSAMYGLVKNECGEYPAGGSYRSGDACVVVDTPGNPLKMKRTPTPTPAPAPAPNPKLIIPSERKAKEIRRSLVAEAKELDGRCDPPPGPCYTYNEGAFITSVQGPQQRVCDNILPNGARCDQTRSVTTSESCSISTDIGGGIKDVVDIGASFTGETSSSSTESITTSITVDCENGGYVVWYPLMQISKGECGRGPQETCDGGCITDTVTQCQFRKPITAGEGRLSGEYDVQCI